MMRVVLVTLWILNISYKSGCQNIGIVHERTEGGTTDDRDKTGVAVTRKVRFCNGDGDMNVTPVIRVGKHLKKSSMRIYLLKSGTSNEHEKDC